MLPLPNDWTNSHDITNEGEALLASITDAPILSAQEELEATHELKRQRALINEYESAMSTADGPDEHNLYAIQRLDAQKNYDTIAHRLFCANIRWVLKLVNRSNRLEFMDRFQWAALGLWHAIQMYNPDYLVDGRPVRLSTYATYWIRQRMQRGADSDERLIRLPAHANDILKGLTLSRVKFTEEFGRPPDDLSELCNYAGLKESQIAGLIAIAEFPLSLDLSYPGADGTPGGEGTLSNTIADASINIEEHFVEQAARERVSSAVRDAIDMLERYEVYDERKRKMIRPFIRHAMVVRLRFRIGEPVTPGVEPYRILEEVGGMLTPPVTRERARQLQRVALRWILLNCPELKAYFEGTIED